jgi:two-component system, cell cycle sensor histidine kinase PleC
MNTSPETFQPPAAKHQGPIYLMAILFVLLAVIWGAIFTVNKIEKRDALTEMAFRSDNLAKFFQSHASTTFRYADDYIKTIREIYVAEASLASAEKFMMTIPPNPELLSHITIMDANGIPQLITSGQKSREIKPGTNARDRDYFKFQKVSKTDTVYISAARKGRNTGLITVRLVRRIISRDGKFQGVIFAAIKAPQLVNFFETTRLGPNSSATLIGLDKRIRLRRSHAGFAAAGKKIEGSKLWEKLPESMTGTYEQTSIVDQVPRLWTYRQIENYPVVAVIGSAYRDTLEALAGNRNFRYAVGATISVLGIALVFLARRAIAITRLETEIAEGKRLESELLNAKDAAEDANRAKSDFLAKMSHELRTPLNSIIGYSEAMKEEHLGRLANPKQKDYMASIFESGNHLLGLINTILDISKIEANREELDEELFFIPAMMSASLQNVRPLAEAKNTALTIDHPSSLPQFNGDQGRIVQIFINLLNNAIKFSPTGGSVLFSAEHASNGEMVFTVRDNGKGIAAENINRIVKPFEQIGEIMASPQEGTGLGLAISDSLIKLHGGSMAIESALGEGTAVTVRFPAERAVLQSKIAV